MTWYHWLSSGAFLICAAFCIYHFFRLIRLGKPVDRSRSNGRVSSGVIYSFTAAMSPAKKESAFLHLPTYLAGIVYHIGSFLSIALFIYILVPGSSFSSHGWYLAAALLLVSSACGLSVLVKRFSTKTLRRLSNPDDYISNFLVTLFQLTGALHILVPGTAELYFIIAAVLWLYFPVGKLRHVVYFFAARYHLGFFFGRRGVWPGHKQQHNI